MSLVSLINFLSSDILVYITETISGIWNLLNLL